MLRGPEKWGSWRTRLGTGRCRLRFPIWIKSRPVKSSQDSTMVVNIELGRKTYVCHPKRNGGKKRTQFSKLVN